jgi:hypothetical protein
VGMRNACTMRDLWTLIYVCTTRMTLRPSGTMSIRYQLTDAVADRGANSVSGWGEDYCEERAESVMLVAFDMPSSKRAGALSALNRNKSA